MTNKLAAIDRLDAEIDERLRAVQARIAAAERELTAAKQERVGIIAEATAARWPQSRIGESLGVTKQRVAQIMRANGVDG
jgi:predicted XRE-type DNA-binding protein